MAGRLAVFLVHNVVPGPTLFESRPEFISRLYISLFLVNVVILAFLLIATRWIVFLTRVESRFLGVAGLALSMIGTYTQNYRLSDSLIAAAFGIVGYVLKRNDIPIVPMILGLVLGPILEGRMRQAIGTASGDLLVFVERPVSAAILALILLVIAGSIHGAIRRGRAHADQAPQA